MERAIVCRFFDDPPGAFLSRIVRPEKKGVMMKDLVNKTVTANYLQGMQTLTGKLYFYEDGFSFKADSVNGVIDKGKILYKTVAAVNKRNTLVFIPNGLSVLLDNKDELIFVVNGRNDVRDFLLSKSRKI